jgi:hypothetical protein
LIPDEVDISLSPVLSKHHNLPIRLLKASISGYDVNPLEFVPDLSMRGVE